MKKNIIIFGSGAHSIVVFSEIIKNKKYNFLGFVDNLIRKGEKIISYKNKSYYNLGKIEEVINKKTFKSKNLCGIAGVGFNYIRKKIVNEVLKFDKNFKWESIISKDCILNANVIVGDGSLIMSGAVVNINTIIGEHCIINTSSSIDHDNNFKNFSSCGPGVVTGGNVIVGSSAYLGIGSIIKQNIKIGKNVVIGGNSFVNKNCIDNFVYFGVPIKKIKKRIVEKNYLK